MTQYARPASDISNAGSWSPSTGTDLFAVIDEAATNDSDYVTVDGGMVGAAKTFEVALGAVTDPEVDTGHKLVVRANDAAGVGAVDLTFILKQGSTTIASSGTQTMSSAPANYTTTLSDAEAASITDYSDLRIHVSGVDNMGMDATMSVFQAFFECPNALAPAGGIAGIAYSPARSAASSASFGPTQRTR
jgi:hypothetical protein